MYIKYTTLNKRKLSYIVKKTDKEPISKVIKQSFRFEEKIRRIQTLSDQSVVTRMDMAQRNGIHVCFIRLKGYKNKKYRPVRVSGNENILYDYVVRIKDTEIR